MRKSQTKTTVLSTLKEMVSAGEITPVSVAGVEQPYYALKQSLENIPRVSPKVHILSPFDNLIIQRKKLLTFFDYDYKIECYVPAPKRKYGYFSLPVLQGSRFVARIDCKADRPNQRLMIQSIHYEKNVDQRLLQKKMESKLLSFAKFNGCNALEFNIK